MKKTILYISLAVILALAVFLLLRFLPDGKINSGEFEISTVEIGTIMSTIPAEGEVEPESEVLILSPASSIIKRIVKDVGSKLEPGEAIIILDPTPVQETIDKLEAQLEVKRNSLRKNQLNAKSIRVDLDYNVEVKKLKIASLKSELADQKQLLEVGGISPANYEKTKQELVLAEKDLETLNTRNSIRLQQLEAEEEGLRLEIAIQERELENQVELLNSMIIRAPSEGIILSLDGKVGEKVNKDKLLIEMSNLSNFKINAWADADYSESVKTGKEVIVMLTEDTLKGQVGTINPAIRNKRVEFDVYLEESNHNKLRPNMSLPMRVVVSRVDSAMRVKYGPSIQRSSRFDIYAVDGNEAKKVQIKTGLQGDHFIEIESGLSPGDKVIISDVSLFRNKDEVEIH